ncbi:TPA: hypothetical protein PCO47_003150 [Klebsiella pneumoniae]|nr:hypothetical protein [Klebsiella pneumoniae]
MSTYKTKNPLGSAAVKDLYDNAENVDKFVNDRTKEELEDRLGVLRKTWHGMEMIFSRFIDYITGRGEQAVAAIGWQELGNWAVGLAVDNRQQIVYYNGSWYKYLGELEHVIAGDSPENDGGVWSAANPTGKWSNIGDAALRSNLGSSEEGLGDALVMHHDGKTVSEHIDDYLDLRRNVTTLKALKITADGSTDQTAEFQAALDTLQALDDYWIIDGNGATVITSSMLEIDLCKAGLRNITIKNTAETSDTADYILKVNGSAFSDRRGKGKIIVFERVEVVGAVNRNTGNIHGLLISPDDSIANAVLNGIDIRYVNMGLVFDSNSYLISFESVNIHNCNIPIGTTAYATYLETGTMGSNLSNAGENIRFRNSIFSDSNMCARLAGIEAFITFDTSSFDYTGGSTSVSYKQWASFRQGTCLNFFGCHFEAGNTTDNWTDNYFEVDTSVAINIYGGAMRHSATYNACPYFFYDESTYGQFSIEGTDIWGLGVLNWSNRGLTKFYPMINVQSSSVRAYISEKSDLISDPDFSLSSGNSLIDNWHVVDGTRTGAVVSDVLSCEVVSHTDGASNTYSALKVTKLKASSGATLRLYVRAPRSDFSPQGNLSICADTAITPSSTVSVSVGLAKTKGVVDTYGLPILSKTLAKVTTTIATIDTTMTRVNARGALTKADANNGYDYIFLSLNLGGLAAGDIVYITGINLEIPKRA